MLCLFFEARVRILKRARDLMELRKAELDTCLDERRDEGFDKVVSRLAAIAAPGQQLQTVADFIALAAVGAAYLHKLACG